ncbi:MAG: HEAT repeat domain-containing protein [Candidatus Kapaibacterium sp.]
MDELLRSDEAPLLADLTSPDPNARSRAAVALHRLGSPHALAACLSTLDDAPDSLHSDHTPSVQCLIEIGEPALSPLIGRLQSENQITRIHAERAIQGITRRHFGFDGTAWPDGALERWMEWWSGLGLDISTDATERVRGIEQLRAAVAGWGSRG